MKCRIYLQLAPAPAAAAISSSTNGCLLSTKILPKQMNASHGTVLSLPASWEQFAPYQTLPSGRTFEMVLLILLMKWSSPECRKHSSGSFMHRRKLNNCLYMEDLKSGI